MVLSGEGLIICLSWSYYQAGLPNGQVLRGENGAVARVERAQDNGVESIREVLSGSQTMNQGSQKRITIHRPCVHPLQLLQTAASIKSGPGLRGSCSAEALPAPGGLVDMKASIKSQACRSTTIIELIMKLVWVLQGNQGRRMWPLSSLSPDHRNRHISGSG